MDAAGHLDFDDRRYLGGAASDPRVLGWVEGPPPPGRRVQLEVQPALGFPQIRWSLIGRARWTWPMDFVCVAGTALVGEGILAR